MGSTRRFAWPAVLLTAVLAVGLALGPGALPPAVQADEGAAPPPRGPSIRYIVRSDGDWGAPATVLMPAGDTLRLKVDGEGQPHILYVIPMPVLAYGTLQEGDVWFTDHVTSPGAGRGLDVDREGRPHVAHCGFGPPHNVALWYGHRDALGWHLSEVDPDACDGVALALDGDDNAHLVYSRDDALWHIAWQGGGWSDAVEIGAEVITAPVELALDGDGHPHVLYTAGDVDEPSLRYTFWDGAAWQDELVQGQTGFYAALALDGVGGVHVAYIDLRDTEGEKGLWYARRTAPETWEQERLDETAEADEIGAPAMVSLGVDATLGVHIAYHHLGEASLKYAYREGPPAALAASLSALDWEIDTVDGDDVVGSVVGRGVSLAIDGDGNVHVAYHDATKNVFLPLILRDYTP